MIRVDDFRFASFLRRKSGNTTRDPVDIVHVQPAHAVIRRTVRTIYSSSGDGSTRRDSRINFCARSDGGMNKSDRVASSLRTSPTDFDCEKNLKDAKEKKKRETKKVQK
jgi:hypothetical protein